MRHERLGRPTWVRGHYLAFLTDLEGGWITAFGTIDMKGPSKEGIVIIPFNR